MGSLWEVHVIPVRKSSYIAVDQYGRRGMGLAEMQAIRIIMVEAIQ